MSKMVFVQELLKREFKKGKEQGKKEMFEWMEKEFDAIIETVKKEDGIVEQKTVYGTIKTDITPLVVATLEEAKEQILKKARKQAVSK